MAKPRRNDVASPASGNKNCLKCLQGQIDTILILYIFIIRELGEARTSPFALNYVAVFIIDLLG